ncbi:Hyaluronan / mRNA binding family [Striga hermonthica]|uniref:Hyaluronan / mRNA binding family n=1 Tax=Striga hermonthica TaxID=68872 RepID=A0A9N7R4L5_STRHE|nr:Hyaluronan / mRNA binding family [Striga hermonthica]
MATANPFDLLGDDDAEEPTLLISAQQMKAEPKKSAAPSSKVASGGAKATQAKLPTKPPSPIQAVKEAKSESARGGRGGGRGYGRSRGGGDGSYRDSSYKENSYGNREFSYAQGAPEADGGRPYERRGGYGGHREPFRGGRGGGLSNGEAREGDRERRRQYDRHSGTGQGNDFKKEGAGRGNWGKETDELAQVAEDGSEAVKSLISENPSGKENVVADGDQEVAKNEVVEEKPEDKEMTLEEYEKVLEEKRKALQALKTESRKVDAKEFESMQPLSNKKTNDDIFIKLGSDNKDKKKELTEREERAKKSVSINEFLKPAEGERYINAGGRGRGRGRGFRGGYGGSGGGGETSNASGLSIEDPGQFPSLGSK